MTRPQLPLNWTPYLGDELSAPYMQGLLSILDKETYFPPSKAIFRALELTAFNNVKVVILGQDPYHGQGEAHGLSFSVPQGVKIPPSLQNIFKELQADLGLTPPSHGCLEKWAYQGVLLLNTVLTVKPDLAGSHRNLGWEKFTDKIISDLNAKKNHLVFILWGSSAQKKEIMIDAKRHLVLKSVHPSPLSVYRGFYGSKPFSQTNAYLRQNKIKEIDWSL
jgi:uracil-DNA glycosylase